jgi:tetratricopeptide (TPR) repeat protein
MRLIQRWLASGKVRSASRRLADDPNARHYAELAQLYALQGSLDDALEVATQGLRAYPRDGELRRLFDRTRQMLREGRTRQLTQELAKSPRPVIWRELVELMLEDGRVPRAEEFASEWFQATQSAEAVYWRARARAERYFIDRHREDGRVALELAATARDAMPSDERPLRLMLEVLCRVGAWSDARRVLARLLELCPGEPYLEARFRTVASLVARSKELEACLRDVERTGRFADEAEESNGSAPQNAGLTVRPLLQALTREKGVLASFYVRGATALVQGPRGYTAERTARGVAEILSASRTAGRKLGLGQALEVRLEGSFGTLVMSPSELGAGAVWLEGTQLSQKLEQGLRDLASLTAVSRESQE